jgi:hypothetical protein
MLNRFHNVGMVQNPRDSGVAFLDIPQRGVAPFVVGTVGALFEPSIVIETELIRSDERLIRELLSMLEKQLLTVLEARSGEEFAKQREEVFPKYVRALRALSDTMSNMVPESEMEVLSGEATTAVTNDLEKQRGVSFGNALADQAVFTLWTLGKIRALGRKIYAAGRPPIESRGADLVFLKEYRLTSLWAQFHLDSACAAIKFKKILPDDVQEVICDGLRAVVNAYAVMREALSLRTHVEEAVPAVLPWDEEDERLLASSMRDIDAFSDSDDY